MSCWRAILEGYSMMLLFSKGYIYEVRMTEIGEERSGNNYEMQMMRRGASGPSSGARIHRV